MKRHNLIRLTSSLATLAVAWTLAAPVGAQGGSSKSSGKIVLNIVDPPGVGFNDPTPVSSVGRNRGKTLGEQRRIVFQTAASIWQATLNPNVDIVIQSSFSPLPCTAASGVLGAAGTIQIFANFPDAEWPSTWYHSALANHLAGEDLTPGPFDPGLLQPPFNDDIVAFFNGDIGVNPNCLTGLNWYNGLDNKAPGNTLDLLNVVLHEFGHGLGFANFIDDASGAAPLGLPDIYTVFSRDNTTGLYWNQMDKQQRSASAVHTGNLAWRGPTVFEKAPDFLGPKPIVRVFADPDVDLEAQAASFGAPLKLPPGVSGQVVLYNDGVGPDPNDACNCPFVGPCLSSAPLDPNVAGKIALINRGSCTFALKTAVAQLAGAIGVVITNNQPSGLPSMGGSDLVSPDIPAVGISRNDGNFLKANLGVDASITVDPSLLGGADSLGFPRLYAPNPVEPGSSVSHWDITLTPNALMEPFLNTDLKGARTLDLTPAQMTDIGWKDGPHCPVGSDDRPTVAVGGCSTGAFNDFGPFGFTLGATSGNSSGANANGGCFIQDMVNACVLQGGSRTKSCIEHTTSYLVSIGVITNGESQAIKNCVK